MTTSRLRLSQLAPSNELIDTLQVLIVVAAFVAGAFLVATAGAIFL